LGRAIEEGREARRYFELIVGGTAKAMGAIKESLSAVEEFAALLQRLPQPPVLFSHRLVLIDWIRGHGSPVVWPY
jgi:hypothetical protein